MKKAMKLIGKLVKTAKGPNGETAEIVQITPEIARELLSLNINNRKMRYCYKDKFTRDMKSGNWGFVGSSICIAEDGSLVDGQSRLQACVESGEPFFTVLVTGIMLKDTVNIDAGISRTTADALKTKKYEYCSNLYATAKKMISIENHTETKKRVCSPSEILEEINRPDRAILYEEIGYFSARAYNSSKLLTKLDLSVAYIQIKLLNKYTDEFIKDFFDQVSDQKAACALVRDFRKKLNSLNKVKDKKNKSKERFDLLIRAWNRFAEGDHKSALKKKTDECDLKFN